MAPATMLALSPRRPALLRRLAHSLMAVVTNDPLDLVLDELASVIERGDGAASRALDLWRRVLDLAHDRGERELAAIVCVACITGELTKGSMGGSG